MKGVNCGRRRGKICTKSFDTDTLQHADRKY